MPRRRLKYRSKTVDVISVSPDTGISDEEERRIMDEARARRSASRTVFTPGGRTSRTGQFVTVASKGTWHAARTPTSSVVGTVTSGKLRLGSVKRMLGGEAAEGVLAKLDETERRQDEALRLLGRNPHSY